MTWTSKDCPKCPVSPEDRREAVSSPREPEDEDPQVIKVARAIAEQGFGRPWNDFLPVNAHDTDQGDLIEYARAAVAALRQPAAPGGGADNAETVLNEIRDALEARGYFHMANGRDISMLLDDLPSPPPSDDYPFYSATITWIDEDQAYIGSIPELPGCTACGETPEACIKELRDAKAAWIEACKAAGNPVPQPRGCLPSDERLNKNLVCPACGRDYQGDDVLKQGDACPSDDCPSHDPPSDERAKVIEDALRHLLDIIDAQKRDETPSPKRENANDFSSRTERDDVFWSAVQAARKALSSTDAAAAEKGR